MNWKPRMPRAVEGLNNTLSWHAQASVVAVGLVVTILYVPGTAGVC